MANITVKICWSSSQYKDRDEGVETLVCDLINACVRDYTLPRRDESGSLYRYSLYKGDGDEKQLLDPSGSLRELRVQSRDWLYLASPDNLWWTKRTPGATAPLVGVNRCSPTSMPPSPVLPTRPVEVVSPCQVELAPGCVRQVVESGLIIDRDYLIRELPASVMARERALALLGLPSRLEYVSSRKKHCMIRWNQGWYLFTYQPVYIGGTKYDHGEAIPLEQTTTLLLGREGWPITIRLNSLSMPL